MTSEELETIVCKHEMQRLGLKESFGVECIETACAFTNAEGESRFGKGYSVNIQMNILDIPTRM